MYGIRVHVTAVVLVELDGALFTSSTIHEPSGCGSRSTPTRSPPTASAARTARTIAASGARPMGIRVALSATFVRHSPGAASRRTAPTGCPPATTTRRSCPTGGMSCWTRAPCFTYHGLSASSSRDPDQLLWGLDEPHVSAPASVPRFSTTAGPTQSTDELSCGTWRVSGCGIPARASSRAVRSLSCEANSVGAGLRTRTPRASRAPRHQSPAHTPSRPGVTSRRPSATSPDERRPIASRGGSRRALGDPGERRRAVLVGHRSRSPAHDRKLHTGIRAAPDAGYHKRVFRPTPALHRRRPISTRRLLLSSFSLLRVHFFAH